jgi:glycosyltransferase involved in cell wall biosynthesis
VAGLRQAGHQVTLIYLDGRTVRASDKAGEHRLVPLGLSDNKAFKLVESLIRRVQSELRLPYFGFFDSFRFYEAVRNILSNYDLCHEYYTLFGFGATMAYRRSGIGRVMTIDADLLLERALIGQPLRGLQGAAARWVSRLSFKNAARLICVSEAARNHFVEKWEIEPEKISVIANGVDPQIFQIEEQDEMAQGYPEFKGKQIVMFVGGFQPWHGLELLVEAFARVRERCPKAYLILVGDGPARPGVEKVIESLELG